MPTVSQSDFAKLMNVSRKTVSVWKSQERIVMAGQQVDVGASRERLMRYSKSRSKAFAGATNLLPGSNGAPVGGNAVSPLDDYPASMAAMVDGGAADMAIIMTRAGMPRGRVRTLVAAWHAISRRSATELLEDDLDPPSGFARWTDHPAFQGAWTPTRAEWSEFEAEAARAS